MSSSGLIYAAIVGAWAAYLVPMWLRRQDELNEVRHTERFTTAIRILSRRGALERRYARMIANGDEEASVSSAGIAVRDEYLPSDPALGRAEKAPPGPAPEPPDNAARRRTDHPAAQGPRARQVHASVDDTARPGSSAGAFERSRGGSSDDSRARRAARHDDEARPAAETPERRSPDAARRPGSTAPASEWRANPPAPGERSTPPGRQGDEQGASGDSVGPGKSGTPVPRPSEGRARSTASAARAPGADASAVRAPRSAPAAARRRLGFGARGTQATPKPPAPLKRPDGRAKLLARRRRVVAGLFLLFTAGAVATGMSGLRWLWLPVLPGIALTGYIGYLRGQERRRYEVDLRNHLRATPPARAVAPRPARGPEGEPRRPAPQAAEPSARRRPTEGTPGPPPRTPGPTRSGGERPANPETRARADRREAEERDHAEWIAALHADPADVADRDAWDPVPVPLPTYVTAPVVPRGEPVLPEPADTDRTETERPAPARAPHAPRASAEPPRPTPLFDQYADDTRRAHPYSTPGHLYDQEWPRAGNE